MSPDMHAHSLAYAVEVVGICRGSRWHMPYIKMKVQKKPSHSPS